MVLEIKELLEAGAYSVDPEVVAAAMLARCAKPSDLGDLLSKVLVAAQPGSGEAG